MCLGLKNVRIGGIILGTLLPFFHIFVSLTSRQTLQYTGVVALASVLEALSDQNDNLTLPLYLWSMLVLVDVP